MVFDVAGRSRTFPESAVKRNALIGRVHSAVTPKVTLPSGILGYGRVDERSDDRHAADVGELECGADGDRDATFAIDDPLRVRRTGHAFTSRRSRTSPDPLGRFARMGVLAGPVRATGLCRLHSRHCPNKLTYF